MTSKLPVVGQKYRNKVYRKELGIELILEVAAIDRNDVLGHIIYFKQPNKGCFSCRKYFWEHWEELSDSNPQEAKKEVSEVERALEELKQIQNSLPAQYGLYGKAVQNLINALEAEELKIK